MSVAQVDEVLQSSMWTYMRAYMAVSPEFLGQIIAESGIFELNKFKSGRAWG